MIYDCHDWTQHYHPPPVFLPKSTDLVNKVSSGTKFAKTDFRDGFYHAELAKYTQQFFGVKCKNRFFTFQRLPIGWTLSRLIMQCAMQSGFKHLLTSVSDFLIYYDDLLLYGSEQQVKQAVHILRSSTLSINENKSVLVPVSEITYSGVKLSATTSIVTVLPKYIGILRATPCFFQVTNERLRQVIAGYMIWVAPLTSISYPLVYALQQKVFPI